MYPRRKINYKLNMQLIRNPVRKLHLLLLFSFIIGQSDDRLRLKKADILENITVDGVSMQYLKGNVVFQKGKMTMKCDWARFNKRTENGFLFGNVSMNK